MPKKQPKNAFYYYMLHYKNYEERTNGRRFAGGMKQVAEECGAVWQKLSAEEKKPYELEAKRNKEKERAVPEKLTSYGIPINQLLKEQDEHEKKEADRKSFIVDMLLASRTRSESALTSQKFCIISFNYFEKAGNDFIPAEMGIVRFSLKDGVTHKHHALIDPGEMPMGCRGGAMTHAEASHQLPLPPVALGEKNFSKILEQLVSFVHEEPSVSNSDHYVLLAHEDEIEMVENIIVQLCDNSGIDIESFKILPLCHFFYVLHTTFVRNNFFNEGKARNVLFSSVFKYYTGCGCPLHDKDTVNEHCALNRPSNWAYLMIKELSSSAGVQQKRGFHFPKGYMVEDDSSDDSDDEDSGAKALPPPKEKLPIYYDLLGS